MAKHLIVATRHYNAVVHRKRARLRGLLAISCILINTPLWAESLTLGARARLAQLKDSGRDNDNGQAASIALRGSWLANWSPAISSLIQADWVATGWQNQHSDGVRFNGAPRIPDVAGADINQMFVRYELSTKKITLGRQTLEWDDSRFLSANGFWQNPQSFDALHVDYSLAETSHLQYAYITQALRIFGRDANTHLNVHDINYSSQNGMRPKDGSGEHRMHSHAIQWQWREWNYVDLTGYGYFINNDTAANFSSRTVGARLGYQQKISAWNYRLSLSGARQNRPIFNNDYDLPYWHLQTSLGRGGQEWSLDYEYLGANGGKALITPLGFTHEYQGWADRFTSTPTKGVEDISLRNTSRWHQLRLDMRYHQFFSVEDRDKYGQELDAELGYQFAANKKIAIRMAQFWAEPDYKSSLKSVRNFYLTGTYQY